MRKRAAALLVTLALLMSGCWDMTEVSDTIYVASIGVDSAGEEFLWSFRLVEAEKLVLGMMTAVPGEPGLAGGSLSVRSPSLEQAVQMIQPSLGRIVSLEHVRWIGISEEVARRGITSLLSQFLRNSQVRRGVSMYVFVGRAVDGFLHNKPVSDTNSVKFFEGVRLVQKRMHLSPPMQLQHFYTRLMAPGVDPTLALVAVNFGAKAEPGGELPPVEGRSFKAGEVPRAGGNPVEFLGSGVFRADRLVGLLNINQTESLLSLRGELGKVYASVPDPREAGKLITLRFHQENKPQYRPSFVGKRPKVHVKLQFEGELLSTPGTTDYSRPENRRLLERYIAKFLQKEITTGFVELVYGEWGADPIGFGQLFRSRFPTQDAWLAYRWPDHVRDLAVTLEIEMFIRRFGMLLGNPVSEYEGR
ncbi:MAG TPA: Ger(x)C family spore germination C-terminal domain-containing protein [Symbiobacteriaceae bacterium]|nr:Ger(x)C family spore germination C-terminal domain-containing protein [Symbiobacteriaceae bacterium]